MIYDIGKKYWWICRILERVRKKELGAGTLKNYYRAAKLFCEMNDLTINWRRISKGLYYTDKVQTRLDDGIAEVPFAAILTEREGDYNQWRIWWYHYPKHYRYFKR
jgi:hypothetical protein